MGVGGKHQNVYHALGFSGHGVALALLAGRVIADLYEGNHEAWREQPFYQKRLLPFPPEPALWLGYQALDAAHGEVAATERRIVHDSRLSRTTLAVYGVPSFAFAYLLFFVQFYFLKFATDVLLLAPALVSVLFGLAKLWDGINGPLVGSFSDRLRSRFGRRRPFLVGSLPPLFLGFVMLWMMPSALGSGRADRLDRASRSSSSSPPSTSTPSRTWRSAPSSRRIPTSAPASSRCAR